MMKIPQNYGRILPKTLRNILKISGFLAILIFFFREFYYSRKFDYQSIPTNQWCDKISFYENKFLTFPFITIQLNAGIGNQLFETFSLLGLAKKLNRTPIFNGNDWKLIGNVENIHKWIPNLHYKILIIPIQDISTATRYEYSKACCYYRLDSSIKCEQSKFLVLDGAYFQSFKYFANIRDEIKSIMMPNHEKSVQISKSITKAEVKRKKICVHVRRGDFVTDGLHEGTDPEFTKKSIIWLNSREKFESIFYIFSNDPYWVNSKIISGLTMIRNVHLMTTKPEEAIDDLHFSRLWCDSVLMTAPSSTFGWWLGFLAKNEADVYYRNIQETNDQVKKSMVESDFYPHEWLKIGFSVNGSIIFK